MASGKGKNQFSSGIQSSSGYHAPVDALHLCMYRLYSVDSVFVVIWKTMPPQRECTIRRCGLNGLGVSVEVDFEVSYMLKPSPVG